MTKKTKIIFITVISALLIAIIIICACTFPQLTNADSKYTGDEALEAYNKGYNDGLGEKELYLNIIKGLEKQIEEERQAAEDKYNRMVAYYEDQIKKLRLDIEERIAYTRLLEDYLKEFLEIEAGGEASSLTVLRLQLSAYNAMKSGLINDRNYWNGVLDTLPGLAEETARKEELVYLIKDRSDKYNAPCNITLIENLIINGETAKTITNCSDFTQHPYGTFGDVLDETEYNFAKNQLANILQNGRLSTPKQFERGESMLSDYGSLPVVYKAYYIYAVEAYETWGTNKAIYYDEITKFTEEKQRIEKFIDTTNSTRSVAEYSLTHIESNLSTVESRISDINELIAKFEAEEGAQ